MVSPEDWEDGEESGERVPPSLKSFTIALAECATRWTELSHGSIDDWVALMVRGVLHVCVHVCVYVYVYACCDKEWCPKKVLFTLVVYHTSVCPGGEDQL